jgi:putative SOS response-associated peptidase YedK
LDHFQVAARQLPAFAGLCEKWQAIESCTVFTTEANELSAHIYDRMPVMLSPNDYSEWLAPPVEHCEKGALNAAN